MLLKLTSINTKVVIIKMRIQCAAAIMMAVAISPSDTMMMINAFIPTTLTSRVVVPTMPSTATSTSCVSSAIRNLQHQPSTRSSAASSKTSLSMAMNSQDFDQTQYTDASWSIISTLPQCADYYSATQVEAPMLLSILLNPTKYQASEAASTAKQVVTKLLEDSNVNIDQLKNDVESYLEKQPTVSGDTSTQKSMGMVLGEVLEAGRGVKDGLKVRRRRLCCIGYI